MTTQPSNVSQHGGFASAVELINDAVIELNAYAGFIDPDRNLTAMIDRLSTVCHHGPPVAVVVTNDAQCDPEFRTPVRQRGVSVSAETAAWAASL